jgi:hypothetical protein
MTGTPRTPRTTGRAVIAVAVAAASTALSMSGLGGLSPAAAATTNPAANRAPLLSLNHCELSSVAVASSVSCEQTWLTDINHARAQEGVRPMVLPANYRNLPAGEQIFVLTDLERVDRSLAPVAGITAALNTRAALGAAVSRDPGLSTWDFGPYHAMIAASVQADVTNPLDADWMWMYTDGWGGAGHTGNVDCTNATSTGCWDHRTNVLSTLQDRPLIVAGVAAAAGSTDLDSYAEILTGGTGSVTPQTYRYTWAQARLAGADRS